MGNVFIRATVFFLLPLSKANKSATTEMSKPEIGGVVLFHAFRKKNPKKEDINNGV